MRHIYVMVGSVALDMHVDVSISNMSRLGVPRRDQAGHPANGAVLEVSRTPRGISWLSRTLQSLHVHTQWWWYHDQHRKYKTVIVHTSP